MLYFDVWWNETRDLAKWLRVNNSWICIRIDYNARNWFEFLNGLSQMTNTLSSYVRCSCVTLPPITWICIKTIHIGVVRRRAHIKPPNILMTFFFSPALRKCKYDWLRFVTFEIDIGRIITLFFSVISLPTSCSVFTFYTHINLFFVRVARKDYLKFNSACTCCEKVIVAHFMWGAVETEMCVCCQNGRDLHSDFPVTTNTVTRHEYHMQ